MENKKDDINNDKVVQEKKVEKKLNELVVDEVNNDDNIFDALISDKVKNKNKEEMLTKGEDVAANEVAKDITPAKPAKRSIKSRLLEITEELEKIESEPIRTRTKKPVEQESVTVKTEEIEQKPKQKEDKPKTENDKPKEKVEDSKKLAAEENKESKEKQQKQETATDKPAEAVQQEVADKQDKPKEKVESKKTEEPKEKDKKQEQPKTDEKQEQTQDQFVSIGASSWDFGGSSSKSVKPVEQEKEIKQEPKEDIDSKKSEEKFGANYEDISLGDFFGANNNAEEKQKNQNQENVLDTPDNTKDIHLQQNDKLEPKIEDEESIAKEDKSVEIPKEKTTAQKPKVKVSLKDEFEDDELDDVYVNDIDLNDFDLNDVGLAQDYSHLGIPSEEQLSADELDDLDNILMGIDDNARKALYSQIDENYVYEPEQMVQTNEQNIENIEQDLGLDGNYYEPVVQSQENTDQVEQEQQQFEQGYQSPTYDLPPLNNVIAEDSNAYTQPAYGDQTQYVGQDTSQMSYDMYGQPYDPYNQVYGQQPVYEQQPAYDQNGYAYNQPQQPYEQQSYEQPVYEQQPYEQPVYEQNEQPVYDQSQGGYEQPIEQAPTADQVEQQVQTEGDMQAIDGDGASSEEVATTQIDNAQEDNTGEQEKPVKEKHKKQPKPVKEKVVQEKNKTKIASLIFGILFLPLLGAAGYFGTMLFEEYFISKLDFSNASLGTAVITTFTVGAVLFIPIIILYIITLTIFTKLLSSKLKSIRIAGIVFITILVLALLAFLGYGVYYLNTLIV